MDNRSGQSAILDQAAVLLSGLCLLHCLLLPVLVTLLPFIGQFGDEHLHAELLLVVVPLSAGALLLGYRRHRQVAVIGWGLAGIVLLVLGGTLAHSLYGLLADRLLTVSGSLVLATTHYRNYRLAAC